MPKFAEFFGGLLVPVRPTFSSVAQKQAIADTFGQGATVWELTGKPATESANEFNRLFKEIMGMLP